MEVILLSFSKECLQLTPTLPLAVDVRAEVAACVAPEYILYKFNNLK